MKFSRKDYNERIIDTAGKIPVDEPCFLLRAQDKLAPRLLLEWAMEVRLNGGDPAMALEAEQHAQEMISWQRTHKVKTPDMYRGSDEKKLILAQLKELLSEFKITDVNNLTKLLGEYYDTSGDDLIHILLLSDLKDPSLASSKTLTLNDFKLSNEDQRKLLNCKVIIYCYKNSTYILKNEVQ